MIHCGGIETGIRRAPGMPDVAWAARRRARSRIGFAPMSFEDFLSHLSEVLDVPAAELSADLKLADLEGWNSMALVSFIAFVDEYLGKTLSPRVIGPCRTVADLAGVAGVNL